MKTKKWEIGMTNKHVRENIDNIVYCIQNIYEKSLELVRRWKEGGFYMEVTFSLFLGLVGFLEKLGIIRIITILQQ